MHPVNVGTASASAMVLAEAWSEKGDELADLARLRAADGPLRIQDVARVARCSPKQAKREIERYIAEAQEGLRGDTNKEGVTLTFDSDFVAIPENASRAILAEAVCRKMGLGRFGLGKRIEDRRAIAPPPKEKHMGIEGHAWKAGRKGRSFRTIPTGHVVATLACSSDGCAATHDIRFRELAHADQMDRKFIQAGWILDPARCPEHKPQRKERAAVSSPAKPTPAAIKGQARMFGLLQTHFNGDDGVFAVGWSDEKIATECGLSADLVTAVRCEAFGELKEPPEIAQLSRDIEALAQLIDEAIQPLRNELGQLKQRHAEIRRRFGG